MRQYGEVKKGHKFKRPPSKRCVARYRTIAAAWLQTYSQHQIEGTLPADLHGARLPVVLHPLVLHGQERFSRASVSSTYCLPVLCVAGSAPASYWSLWTRLQGSHGVCCQAMLHVTAHACQTGDLTICPCACAAILCSGDALLGPLWKTDPGLNQLLRWE